MKVCYVGRFNSPPRALDVSVKAPAAAALRAASPPRAAPVLTRPLLACAPNIACSLLQVVALLLALVAGASAFSPIAPPKLNTRAVRARPSTRFVTKHPESAPPRSYSPCCACVLVAPFLLIFETLVGLLGFVLFLTQLAADGGFGRHPGHGGA